MTLKLLNAAIYVRNILQSIKSKVRQILPLVTPLTTEMSKESLLLILKRLSSINMIGNSRMN